MKRFLTLLTILLCLFSFAHAEQAEKAGLQSWLEEEVAPSFEKWMNEDTVITAVGTAQVVPARDVAVLSFSLEAKGETVSEANEQISKAVSSLNDALKAQGVQETDITQSRYDVSPDVQYHNTKLTDISVINAYIVTLQMNVRLNDVSSVGAVIDAAMQSGAGSTHDMRYESSNARQAYQTALAQAVEQAMEKAQIMAQSCQMELGALVSVVETSTQQDEYAVVEVTYQAE